MEKVVIVDDDVRNLETAKQILSDEEIEVTTFESGQVMLEHLRAHADSMPDLILLDTDMPEMDGFETLEQLRALTKDREEIPVIFLSDETEQEYETRSLRLGAMDYIRKPFVPEILAGRVGNALRTQEKLMQFERDAMIDQMTGFLNKTTAEDKMHQVCRTETGFLCILDLDSFKLINDLYGHDMGDRVLVRFSQLLKNSMRSGDLCGRIGGDEFLLFARDMTKEEELQRFTNRINRDYLEMIRQLLGDRPSISAGVSIGAAAVPVHGRDFKKLFHLADQALSIVKLNGKHNCALNGSGRDKEKRSGVLNLDSVTMILEERNVSASAMWMGREAFVNVYRYMMRYMLRYHGVAYNVLFTIRMNPDPETGAEKNDAHTEYAPIMAHFRELVQTSLRNSDVMFEVSQNQIFLLLPETGDAGVDVVINRLMGKWDLSECSNLATISWEKGKVHLAGEEEEE